MNTTTARQTEGLTWKPVANAHRLCPNAMEGKTGLLGQNWTASMFGSCRDTAN